MLWCAKLDPGKVAMFSRMEMFDLVESKARRAENCTQPDHGEDRTIDG